MEFNSVCVLGLGYIGLPTACLFATSGIKVIGVDTNNNVIESLSHGKTHIFEPGLQELFENAVAQEKLLVKGKPQTADAFIISVPTPFRDGKQADLSYVISAAELITPCLKNGNLVILESTSPPRTTIDIVAPILEKSGLKAGVDFLLAYSPERVLPGQILREMVQNDRVIGGIDKGSSIAGKALYSTFVRGQIATTDATTAEMVKLMENTYRDINIAAANEFARLAEVFSIDIWEAIRLANRHPRVEILNPGPGVGGHCISVDPWFLVKAAPEISELIHTARLINDSQPNHVVDLLKKILGSLKGRKIAALGLAYKPDVDDLRESPAVRIVELLIEAGSEVNIFEPYKSNFVIPGANTTNNLSDAVKDAEIILLLVGHTQFRSISPEHLKSLSQAKYIFDSVNIWEEKSCENFGYSYFRLGDGKSLNIV